MKLFYIVTPCYKALCEAVFLPTLRRVEPRHRPTQIDLDVNGNGDFYSDCWHRTITLKYLSIMAAIDANDGEAIAFVDADVVFFRPFINQALGMLGEYDLVGQAENPDGGTLNTGVLFMRCTPTLRRVLAIALQFALVDQSVLPQQFVQECLDKSGLRWKTLPTVYASETNKGMKTNPGEALLYHANATGPREGRSSLDLKAFALASALVAAGCRV